MVGRPPPLTALHSRMGSAFVAAGRHLLVTQVAAHGVHQVHEDGAHLVLIYALRLEILS